MNSNIISTKFNNNIFELKFKNKNDKLYALLFKYKTLENFVKECIFPILNNTIKDIDKIYCFIKYYIFISWNNMNEEFHIGSKSYKNILYNIEFNKSSNLTFKNMYPVNYFRQYSCCSLNQITTLTIRIKTKQDINKNLITNEINKYLKIIYNDIKIKNPSKISKKLFELQNFNSLDEIKNYISDLVLKGADINYFNDEDYESEDFYEKYEELLSQESYNDIIYYKNGGVYDIRENDDESDVSDDDSDDETENINIIKVYYRLLDYICSLKSNFNKEFSYKDLCIFLNSLNYNFMNDYDEFSLFTEMKYKNNDVLNYIRNEYLEKIENFNPEIYLINHIIENNNNLVKDPLMIEYNSSGKKIDLFYQAWYFDYDYPKILFNFKPSINKFNFNVKNNIINNSIICKLSEFILINYKTHKKYNFSDYINKQEYFLFDNIENNNLKNIKIKNVFIKYILNYISEYIIDDLKLNDELKINNKYKKNDININNICKEQLENYLNIDNKYLLKMYYKYS